MIELARLRMKLLEDAGASFASGLDVDSVWLSQLNPLGATENLLLEISVD